MLACGARDARPGGLFDPGDTHGLVTGIGYPGPLVRATRLDGAGPNWRVYADPAGKPFCLVWTV